MNSALRTAWKRPWLIWLIWASVYVALALWSIRSKSATWDEPLHLAAGYRAWHQDFRFDPEHPPLARMVQAAPLLLLAIDDHILDGQDPIDQWSRARRFFLAQRHPTQVLAYARCMTLIWMLALGAMLLGLANKLFGARVGFAGLVLLLLEPNLMAHGRLATNDAATATAVFAVSLCLWRLTQTISWKTVAMFVFSGVAAILIKHSALLVVGIAALAVCARALSPACWPMPHRCLQSRAARMIAAGSICAMLLIAVWAGIWAGYGFRYAPVAGEPATVPPAWTDSRLEQLPATVKNAFASIDRARLLPQAYSRGVMLMLAKSRTRAGYLLGQRRTTGWWYYFLLTLLFKVPLGLLLAIPVGIAACASGDAAANPRWRPSRADLFALGIIPLSYLLAISAGNLNIGLRHALPLVPFIVLVAAAAVALKRPIRRVLTPVLFVLVLFDFGRCYPNLLAAFNTAAGGPSHGHELLVDSNLDWGQDLPRLASWLRAHRVEHVGLSYFGSDEPERFGIKCRRMPLSSFPVCPNGRQVPQAEFLAVSATNLHGVYAPINPYRRLLELEATAVIGHTIFVYRLGSNAAKR